jgi:putative membrane protein
MSKSIYRFFQCMIVIGLAAYLSEKWISGRLSFYINPRFAIFTLIGIVGLTTMAVIGLNSLFAEKQPSINSQSLSKSSTRINNLAVLFISPIIVAILGLSIPVIFTLFLFVFVIGLVRLNQHSIEHQHAKHQHADIPGMALVLLGIPLIFGVIVPARPLSTASLSTRGMSLSAPVSIGQQSINTMEIAPDDRTVLDWIKIFNYEKDLTTYLDTDANVIGFVYHDPRLSSGQFMVGRFTVTCCVADAFAIGMAVDWTDSAKLEDNTWVNVTGTVEVLEIDGQKVPLIRAETVRPIQAPEQPYLYP